MKILWLINIMLPAYARQKNLDYSEKEGWISGIYNRIVEKRASGDKEIELGICFPSRSSEKEELINGVHFYPFKENTSRPEYYDKRLESRLSTIIESFNPDAVHIFGTEYPHTLAMVRALGQPHKAVISLQGIMTRCADEYRAGLPDNVWNSKSIRDILRSDSLKTQQKKFETRAARERSAMLLCYNIAGRTDMDRKFTQKLCPRAYYHTLNETLRPVFYEDDIWSFDDCRKHSIFISQGDYPLKGFHFLLRALPELVKLYPDIHVYCAGNRIFNPQADRGNIKISAYGEYLRQIVRHYNLSSRISLLGMLSAQEMKETYKKSHVFLCPSVMENSPNSMGEAMILGMPVAASRTGGIPSMLENQKEGILFEKADIKEMIRAIADVFDNKDKAISYGRAARERALKTHDIEENYRKLMSIYETVVSV